MENLGYFVSQNLSFCILFIFILSIYVIFELVQSQKAQYSLPVSEAVMMVNKDKGMYLDIRDSSKYNKSHIIGAHNISIVNLADRYKILAKNKTKPIIIYGDQSEKAMQLLRKKNFEKAYILKGGLEAWLQANYPVKSS